MIETVLIIIACTLVVSFAFLLGYITGCADTESKQKKRKEPENTDIWYPDDPPGM